MYEAKAYRCSYCKKYGLSKYHIVKHESTCFRNPITRSCSICANRASNIITDPVFGTIEVPYCLEGFSFVNPVVDPENRRKIKMYTNCAKWVDRPEEEEQLAIYQRTKEVENINTVILDVLNNVDEYPF